jgi:hypothetical protein
MGAAPVEVSRWMLSSVLSLYLVEGRGPCQANRLSDVIQNMKQITCTISADGENLGSFTLDPITRIRLMADAKLSRLSLPEFIDDVLVQHVWLRACAVSDELLA